MRKLKHIKLFENYSNQEEVVTELDNWIEANSEKIEAYDLKEKVEELIGNMGKITVEEETIENEGGKIYGENWNTKVITVKLNGKDLVKVCTKSDGRYDYGACSNIFSDVPQDKKVENYSGVRFYFDRSLLKMYQSNLP